VPKDDDLGLVYGVLWGPWQRDHRSKPFQRPLLYKGSPKSKQHPKVATCKAGGVPGVETMELSEWTAEDLKVKVSHVCESPLLDLELDILVPEDVGHVVGAHVGHTLLKVPAITLQLRLRPKS